jgi:hypothetical protein
LEDTGSRDVDVLEAASTLRHGFLAGIQIRDEASAELLHFGKRVRLAALVGYNKWSSFADMQDIRLKIPTRIGSSCLGLGKQVVECGGSSQSDVLREVRANRRVKSGWVASSSATTADTARLPLRQRRPY